MKKKLLDTLLDIFKGSIILEWAIFSPVIYLVYNQIKDKFVLDYILCTLYTLIIYFLIFLVLNLVDKQTNNDKNKKTIIRVLTDTFLNKEMTYHMLCVVCALTFSSFKKNVLISIPVFIIFMVMAYMVVFVLSYVEVISKNIRGKIKNRN